MAAGEYEKAAGYLNNIVAFRDFLAGHDLWPSFSVGMNLLGYEGNFAPDYMMPFNEACREELRAFMLGIGEAVK